MKIYNRKSFVTALLNLGLCVWLLVLNIRNGFNVKDSILIFILGTISINMLYRSFSKTLTEEDLIEENDERNKLLNAKIESKTFRIVKRIFFIQGILFIVLGIIYEYDFFLGLAIAYCSIIPIGFITEIILSIYYENKNM